ncbi:unnamed protein product, partial [Didymodactylos carnosus]
MRSGSWLITPGCTQKSICSVYDFGKGIGTKCKIGHLEYTDENGDLQLIPCHFENRPNVGKTKGLLELVKDLNVNVPAGCLLPELRDLLSQHPAFKT